MKGWKGEGAVKGWEEEREGGFEWIVDPARKTK
jgi:hypothetical protein